MVRFIYFPDYLLQRYGDTVNLVGLIAVDSASVSRINLTDAQRWQYREKEKGRTYKAKGGRSGASYEQERRSHVAHFRNTLAAQSQPEGTWSVERMALSDVGVAWKRGKERKRPAGTILPSKNFNNHFYFYYTRWKFLIIGGVSNCHYDRKNKCETKQLLRWQLKAFLIFWESETDNFYIV